MLDLIIISMNMNSHVKPSVNIKKLSLDLEDQKKVLNNELSKKRLEELNNYILNYKKESAGTLCGSDLNIDFINGLFDSEG
ncbi:hypothetical protein [Enterobacter mori]